MTQETKRRRMSVTQIVLLGLLGVGAFLVMQRGCFALQAPWALQWDDHLFTFGRFGHFYGLLGIWGLIQVVLAIWVGVDANRKGLNGLLWGLLVLITNIVGLVIYLIAAPLMLQKNGAAPASPVAAERRCLSCQARVESEFKVCPFCSASLCCEKCEQRLEAGWKVCPQCAAPIGGGSSGA